MRIVLLSTPTRVYTPNYIVPTGIISIAAYLEQCGHEVRVVDAAALRESNESIVRRVAEFEPHVIGIGGIITAYAYIIPLTHDLKKALPKTPIVLGGQVSINNDQNCFRHMAIDYIVHGYGEFGMEKLIRHFQGQLALEAIPGISYRDKGAIITNPGREFFKNIDEMPLPAYHLIDMEHYATVNGHRHAKLHKYLEKNGKSAKNHRFCTVMGTLGCTDRCTFCVHEQEYVGLKVFSNDYVLRHIRLLHETYDINVLAIGEEMFITKLTRAREFNNLMKEHFPNIYWSASTRADFITPQMVAELETGNCFFLSYGFESGSKKMLDLMKKRMTREQNILAYTLCDTGKLVGSCSLMVGNVGETHETVKETISAVREAHIGRATVFFASPYPGGRTWDWAVERGLIKDTHEYLIAASDKDAGSRINMNLTPHPDWILKGWQQMVMWECEKQEWKKEHKLYSGQTFLLKWRKYLRPLLGYTYIPTPIMRVLVELYFLYYRTTRKFFKTKKDRQFEYKLDKKGSLLPEKLNVSRPQTHLSPEQLSDLVSQPRVRIPIHAVRG